MQLEGTLDHEPSEGSSEYGRAFEHFLILELYRMAKYRRKEDRFSYIRTKDDVEIDLLIERSRKELWAIEIRSSKNVSLERLTATRTLAADLKVDRFIIVSREEIPRRVDEVEILPWRQVIQELYG